MSQGPPQVEQEPMEQEPHADGWFGLPEEEYHDDESDCKATMPAISWSKFIGHSSDHNSLDGRLVVAYVGSKDCPASNETLKDVEGRLATVLKGVKCRIAVLPHNVAIQVL
jgi:hypothetical protein